MLTARSHQLAAILSVVRAGVRSAHLRSSYADDAVQQTLVALLPQLERLMAMTERERGAYIFVAASRTAMSIRKRVGYHEAVGTDAEVNEWAKWNAAAAVQAPSPEHQALAAESIRRANNALNAMEKRDQQIVSAVVDDGLSEREVAQQLGISRGNVVYRLRRARQVLGRAWSGTTSWARKIGSR
jgi:RNA polymerase sigma factor (sigma-70 family)